MKLRAVIALTMCALCAVPAFASLSEITESPHFIYHFDKAGARQVDSVRQSAEGAYGRISGMLDFAPTQRIPVYLYSDRKEFTRETGIKRSEIVLGVATSVDEAIRLDASQLFEAPDRTVGHEVAHIFLYYMLGPYTSLLPLWMNEGIAQVAGGADGTAAASRVSDALANSRFIPLGRLTNKFPEGEDASLAYDEAQCAVTALLEKEGGWPKVRALLGELRAANTFDDGMRKVYGVSAGAWEARWKSGARHEARFAFLAAYAEWVVPFMMFAALIWGITTVRRHRRKQIRDEEPIEELAPPSWWKEDQWR